MNHTQISPLARQLLILLLGPMFPRLRLCLYACLSLLSLRFLPGAMVVEGQHAVVAVLAVLRPWRPHDVARDAVVQLVTHIRGNRVGQARGHPARNNP